MARSSVETAQKLGFDRHAALVALPASNDLRERLLHGVERPSFRGRQVDREIAV